MFDKAPCSESEFMSLLHGVVEGRAVDYSRIREIAAALAPLLPTARGRKVSVASAAHEAFLEAAAKISGPCGYTWSAGEEDFTDKQTGATRREFAEPDFDPRAAYRRLKAR
jgi:hypothetical protein